MFKYYLNYIAIILILLPFFPPFKLELSVHGPCKSSSFFGGLFVSQHAAGTHCFSPFQTNIEHLN